MISFSNLYEAVVQQPTPPQQPVQQQQTGIRMQQPQNQMQQPVQQGQYQYSPQYQGQQPVQQQEQKPTSIFGKIKAGYDKINDKYESGKEVAKGLAPIAASLAVPVGMYGASFVTNPALASTLRNVGIASMLARPMLSAARQARVVAQQPRQ